MAFYRMEVKVGHWGTGNYGLMVLYTYAKNYTTAISRVRFLPMVKHKDFPISKSTIVGEDEFVSGVVHNGYSEVCKDAEDSINCLDTVVKACPNSTEYQFETEKGQELAKFCEAYKNAEDKQKPSIEQQYREWVQDLLTINTSVSAGMHI